MYYDHSSLSGICFPSTLEIFDEAVLVVFTSGNKIGRDE